MDLRQSENLHLVNLSVVVVDLSVVVKVRRMFADCSVDGSVPYFVDLSVD